MWPECTHDYSLCHLEVSGCVLMTVRMFKLGIGVWLKCISFVNVYVGSMWELFHLEVRGVSWNCVEIMPSVRVHVAYVCGVMVGGLNTNNYVVSRPSGSLGGRVVFSALLIAT